MALTRVRDLVIPHLNYVDIPNDAGFTSMLIDASGEKAGFVVQVDKAGTINKVGFRTGTVTTAQTLRVSLQTVDLTTGFPTGTLYGGSTAGTQTSPASSTYYEVTLGTGATAVAGDIIAIVIEFDSTVGNLNISAGNSSVSSTRAAEFPYSVHFTASWAFLGENAITHLGYSDGTYEPIGALPFASMSVTPSLNITSTPDEVALRFSLPFDCSIRGIVGSFYIRGDTDLVYYDGTTAVATKSFDADLGGLTGSGFVVMKFNSKISYTRNTVRRISFKPTTGTDIFPLRFTVLSNAILDSYGGKELYWSQRTDEGAWTDTTTQRLFVGLLIEEIHDTGGLLVHPGMSGGTRG